MRRRFLLWAVIVATLLGGSSVVGVVVTGVINPREYDYSRSFVAMPSAPAARTDLANARPVEFGPPAVPTQADAALFQAVLDRIADPEAFRRSWVVQQHINFERMAEELARVGVYAAVRKTPTDQSILDDARTLETAVNGLFGRADGPITWDRCRVVRAARSPSGTEAVVLARHVTRIGPGVGERVEYRRWWMQNGTVSTSRGRWVPTGWRVYDFDEPGTRLRYTVTQGGVLADGTALGPADGPPVLLNTPNGILMVGGQDDEGVVAVRAALAAAADGDRAAVAARMASARRWQMIPALAAVREVAEGRLLLLDGRPADAIKKFDAALRRWPDTPAAHLGRAAALNAVKRHADALTAVGAFRTAVGDDPEAVREFARAKAGQADVPAAVAALRAGVKEFPGAVGLLAEWYRVSPADKRGDVGELTANAPDPGPTLAKLLRQIEPDDPTGAGAAAVVAGYRTILPTEPAGMVEQALVKVRQGRPADAVGPLRDGLAGMGDDDHRAAAVGAFARAAVRVGRAAEGYDAAARVGRAADAFRPLVEAALAGRGPPPNGLAAVLDAHAGKHPADPWPHYYRAEVMTRGGDHAAAEKQLAAGMAKLAPPPPRTFRHPPPEAGEADVDPRDRDWNQFRAARVVCLHKLGQWRRAYDDLPPKVDTFDQLARLFAQESNADGLLALTAAHQKAVPDDAEVIVWRAEGHFLKKDYEAVVAACLEYAKAAPDTAVPARAADRWVRALVRLGRAAAAGSVAETAAADTGRAGTLEAGVATATLRTLVAAATGDAVGTEDQLKELRRLGGSVAEMYADPDLGPLLRKPEFAGVRRQFPPPKGK